MNPNAPNDDIEPRRRFPGPNAHRAPQYKFSADEIRVIKECNKEAFYQRCLPLCGLFGFGTYYGVKTGYLKPSLRFGAAPKVTVAVIFGYFLGKFSYQKKCAEKLMQLPNSQLGEILRQRRRGGFQESLEPGLGTGMSLAPFGSVSESDVYSDLNPHSSLDLDTTRPETPGLEDQQRPSLDNPMIYEDEMPPIQKHMTTYDELRKQNREEYQQRRIGNYKEPIKTLSPDNRPLSGPSMEEFGGAGGPQMPRNKYGDVWG